MLLQVFQNESFEVRTLIIDGAPYFAVVDVCKILGIQNATKATSTLDQDGLSFRYLTDSLGRDQQATFANEPNLFRLIMKSRKPEARRFEKWVFEEVLPTIRKTGSFNAAPAIPSHPEALRQWAAALEANTVLENRIQALKPGAKFAETVEKTENTISLTECSKLFNIPGLGPNKFFEHLRQIRILYRKNGYNVPHQKYIDSGYFKVKESVYRGDEGKDFVTLTTTITGKGQTWLFHKLTGKTLNQQQTEAA